LLHNHPHLSSGACTIGQKWPQYLGTWSHPTKKKAPLIFRRGLVNISSGIPTVLTDGLIGEGEVILINEAKGRPKRQIKNLENK
jgi:hypothetical protein